LKGECQKVLSASLINRWYHFLFALFIPQVKLSDIFFNCWYYSWSSK